MIRFPVSRDFFRGGGGGGGPPPLQPDRFIDVFFLEYFPYLTQTKTRCQVQVSSSMGPLTNLPWISSRQGINVSKGKHGMDFSDGKGFYQGTDFWKSYDWAKRGGLTKKKKGVAVLVFKASAADLFQETDGKQFPDASEEWINFFRSMTERCKPVDSDEQKGALPKPEVYLWAHQHWTEG